MANKLPTIEERKSMYFREAEGKKDLPAQLNWGEIDDDLRLLLWKSVYMFLNVNQGVSREKGHHFYTDAHSAVYAYYDEFERLPVDEVLTEIRVVDQTIALLKEQILNSPFEECMEVVQLLMRNCNDFPLPNWIKSALESPRSPYMVVDDPPTIIPRGSPEEGETVAKDLQVIAESGLSGARAHLISAAEALNKGDNRGAIREAIHAVESASKIVSDKPKATLPDCLKILEKEHGLHAALKKAFDSLYGYTSDEKGIRHALLEGDNKKVGTDEALFMFSACTAFVSYLARKFPEKS